MSAHVNYASFETRQAYLNTPFGLGLAQLWFGLTVECSPLR